MKNTYFMLKRKALIAFLLFFPFILPAVPASAQSGLERSGRWFTYDGQPVFLAGFDTQEIASDPTIDYVAALDEFTKYNINKTRIWVYTWFGETSFNAYTPWAKQNGKHNLDQWNSAYWQRVKDFIREAEKRGIIVEVTLFSTYPAPANFMWNNPAKRVAWNKEFNTNNAFTTNSSNHFYPEFFDLNLREKSSSGKTLKDYQQAVIDKTIAELGSFPNVYFEIHNEYPAVWRVSDAHPIDRAHGWQTHWINYVNSNTSRLVSANSVEVTEDLYGIDYFKSNPNLDVMNFHLHESNPNKISDMLHPLHTSGKILFDNESLDFHNDLDGQMRQVWGLFLSGGHGALYEDDSSRIGSSGWINGAKRLQAMRAIVESVPFWRLSPVDSGNNEYDGLVSQGPAYDWQVMADPGSTYFVYFWGTKRSTSRRTSAKINVQNGSYRYTWYDVRNAAVLGSGSFTGSGVVTISSPSRGSWSGGAGLVLVVQSSTVS